MTYETKQTHWLRLVWSLASWRSIACLIVVVGIAFWQFAAARPVVAQDAGPLATEPLASEAPGSQVEEDAASEAAEETQYVRVHEDEDGDPTALQTAIVRYVGKPGTPFAGKIVDLVGVVHIGQAEYYQQLSELLSQYDTVLYELVAPDGTRIKPEDLQKRRSLLASVQTGMKDMLNLEYQLEKIDYMAENFRHADMSPDEFVEDLERRGDSVWKMVARMMGAGLASQSKSGGDVGLLMAFFSSDRSKMMKRAMANQLVDIDMVTAGMNDADGENTLIKGRNRKAFEILRDELEKELPEPRDTPKSVAVFYGAGHLLDMAKRLESDFGMVEQPDQSRWLDAWDLTRN
ncbi:TraB/GumN family protein [Neorhodopirellula lusitana]|uniref:hypothetical protein n=1 Tax=Neorhodopirellula lusitana TaxID=445327 RepID=UPI00384F56E0